MHAQMQFCKQAGGRGEHLGNIHHSKLPPRTCRAKLNVGVEGLQSWMKGGWFAMLTPCSRWGEWME